LKNFIFRYLILLTLGFFLLKLPALEPFVGRLCELLAAVTQALMATLDSRITVQENIIRVYTGGIAIKVTKGCSGLTPLIATVAAILAFPSHWQVRVKAIVVAALIVQSINIIRLVVLFYSQIAFSRQTFDIIHGQVWPLLFSFLCAVLFLQWALQQLNAHRLVATCPADRATS